MEELQKLYDVLVREGKYTKSFEEFQSKWSQDEAYKNKVYDVVNRDGLYSKDRESFFQKYSAKAPVQKIQEEEVIVKKKDTELPLGDGGLGQPKFPEQRTDIPVLKKDELSRIIQGTPKSDTDRFLMEQKEKAKKFQEIVTEIKGQEEKLKKQQKIAQDLFDRQTTKPQVSQSELLRERLSNINQDLINREEEFVVPELQYLFEDLGFEFEETGMTGDFVKVKAPNQKTIEISLDNFLDSKSEKEANKLKKFIEDNTPQKGLFVLENTIREQDRRFSSQKQVDDEVKKVNSEVTSLNAKQKDFLLRKSQYQSKIEELERTPVSQRSTDEFNNKLNALEKERSLLFNDLKSILQEEEVVKQKNKSLEKSVGKYSIAKAKQGTWGGGLRNAFLTGFGKISAGMSSIGIDILTEVLPTESQMSPKDLKDVTTQKAKKLGVKPPTEDQTIEDWKKTLTPKQLEDWEDEIDDYVKKSAKKDILPATRTGLVTLAGDPDTTLEWNNLKKQDFWGGAFLGLAESIPAMIGGSGPAGWAQRTALMYSQIADGLSEEMENDPDFANISENEKLLITLPIGITSAVLEAYGLRNVLASKGIINSITMSVLGKSGKNVSAKTFRELVEDEVENRIAKGLLVVGAAGLAEGETGALQEISETSFKAVYNDIKGKGMFEMPESALDFVENVVVAGGQEAVGGFVLGVPSAVSSAFAQKGFLKMDDASFEMFVNIANDENMQSAYIAKLKERIAIGSITTAEAKKQLNDYRNSVGLFRQLPEGLNTQQQKEAMNLLKEKRDLENFIQGKDVALVVKQKNRIDEINNSLTELSEQPSAEYVIDGKQLTKDEFISQLEGKTKEELDAMNIVVNNDQETANIVNEKLKTDAIQIESTTEVPVQSETGVSEKVEKGISQPKPETVTETQKEIAQPLRDVESTAKALEEVTKTTNNDNTDKDIAFHGTPYNYDKFDASKIGTGEGASKRGIGIYFKRSKILAPFFANINSDDVPIHFGKGKSKVDKSNIDPHIFEVSGFGNLKLKKGSSRDVGLWAKNQEKYVKEGYDGFETESGEITVFPESIDKVSINKKNTLSDFVAENPNFQFREWTTEKGKENKIIAEAYHKAKADGSNPKLVQAVETLLAPTVEGKIPQPKPEVVTEQVTQKEVTAPQTIIEEEKITVFRGKGSNVMNMDNDSTLWVAEDENVAKNYAGVNEEGSLDVEKIDVNKPKKSIEMPYKLATEVRASNIGDNLRLILRNLQKEEKISNDNVTVINNLIKNFEIKAGNELELFTSKINKPESREAFSEVAQALGFDSILQKESATLGGAKTNTYGIFVVKYPSLLNQEQVSSKTQPITQIEAQDETVQPERTGDGTGRATSRTITPLEGSPIIQGATGPDANLVAVAEQYAADNGIDLKRQSEYVVVDEERAKRIADAYEQMVNDPQNPKVKEAYEDLIRQTKAQYDALVDVGYEFTFFDDQTDPYDGNPYNAMRDLRNNKKMAVYGTFAGYGTEGITDSEIENNPLLEDTGLRWKDQNGNEQIVTANDLFRAVHDAFGHGLEGTGFRARGEENAWQAHVRLFTGPAIAALTSETRGQNSWLNYGPFGETNRTAKLEDTVFAEQKIGLMPEFTWTEGRAGDVKAEAEVSQGLNEQDLPGYDRMMGEVEGIIEKSKKRRVNEAKIADNVTSYVMGSKVYENATDVQREALVRDIRKRFGLKEKAAPSIARILGKIKDVKKVTMTEKTALKKQIKDLARGARDAVRAQKLVAQQLTKDIKELASEGKITANQAANVLRAFSKVNVFSQKSIDRFTDYMTRVFENADYAAKIKQAKSDRGAIKKLSRNKDKNANLRVLAAEFVKIDPALVEDIEAYNDMASKIKEAVKGSSVRGQKVKFAETVNIQDATDYINKIKKEQEEKLREEKIAEIQSLMDVDASEFSTEDMLAILGTEEETPEGTKKYNEGIVRATVKRAFDVYSSMIKKSINTGKDVFTDEDVSYTSSQKKLIKDFMAMDTDNMSIKDSVEAIDSLVNFLVNQSTAKMEAVVRKYTGQQNAAKIRKEGIFAVPLKKLGLEFFGRFLGEQTTTLNILFEKMFVGFNRSAKVMEAMGINDLINGKSSGQRQSNNIIKDYVSQFYDKKANGQKFNTLFNNVERGMAAFTSRTVIGTEAEMQAEFNRRKKLIEESIEVLSSGNEKEVAKSLVYQEVYDKILKNSNNISDVESKVDKTNLEAIDFWKKQWDDKFERLSDTALNIYNKVLDKDLNYIPDRFTRISYDGGSFDLTNNDSAFISNTNGRLYKKQTGVLMDATKPKKLPTNPNTNEAESYIDLSFDKNNSNSMYDALVDIETAGPIRQVDAFMKTSDFRKIFGKDGDIIKGGENSKGRVQQYIDNIRGKNPYSNDEFSKMMQGLNKVATLGVGQALAGPTQPLKQVLPVITNTLINNKGNIDFSAMSNPDFMNWLNDTGYAISNRGVESQSDIDSINSLINQAAESKVEKGLKIIEDANKKYLKLFLVKPDVWIAVSSWKSYYEQSLKQQGIEPSGIDYSTHEVNKKAADYAQRMVDRQQNISDTDLAGSLFANRNPFAQIGVKIFMPFASFRMNQASRLGSDLRTLQYWNVSTAEDKKIAARSLAGYAVEMATFRALSASISILLASAAASLIGRGDDEEEKEKRNKNLIKGALTSTVTDIFSPIPVVDKLIQNTASDFLKLTQDALDISEKDRVSLYESKKQNTLDGLGTFGIAAKRGEEVWNILSMSVTGEYKNDFGQTRVISEEDQEVLGNLFPFVLAANLTGLASPEVSTVGRNAVRISKKKAPSIEQREAKDKKIEIIEDMISKSKNPKQREAAEKLLEKIQIKDSYELEEQELKEMKNELLVDKVKGVTYKTVSDLKRYNKPLWIRNFGPKSEWNRLTKEDKAAEKILREELQKEKDKEYGYTKPIKRKKNKDGTYKKSYSYKKKKD
jgi:hypothetical protein